MPDTVDALQSTKFKTALAGDCTWRAYAKCYGIAGDHAYRDTKNAFERLQKLALLCDVVDHDANPIADYHLLLLRNPLGVVDYTTTCSSNQISRVQRRCWPG